MFFEYHLPIRTARDTVGTRPIRFNVFAYPSHIFQKRSSKVLSRNAKQHTHASNRACFGMFGLFHNINLFASLIR